MPFFIGSRGRIHHQAWLPDGDVKAIVVFSQGGSVSTWASTTRWPSG
jgi:hypothetical protein